MYNLKIDNIQQKETPFYYYDTALLAQTLSVVKNEIEGFPYEVHFAVKANANSRILSQIFNAGIGADCVSGPEVKAAIEAGCEAKNVVFAGVGKTDKEINFALDEDIFCFNVESLPELLVINELAKAKGKVANIALRVNPNIDAHTHKYITTGLNENKFGISLELLDDIALKAVSLPNINLLGVHFHIGSQLTDMKPYEMLCNKINELQLHFDDLGIKLQIINVGGGLGINYENPDENPIPNFKDFFNIFKRGLQLRDGQRLYFELGRSIVAQCGTLVSKVTYVKEGLNKKFIIVDAGMTDLIRPALYQAHHVAQNISSQGEKQKYDIVGPICESSDCFCENEMVAETKRGDYVVFRSAGAYGQIMASQYNCRSLPRDYYSE